MVACLGYGVAEVLAAAGEQAEQIAYFYNHHFTSEPQERLAERVLEVAAPGMSRARFVSAIPRAISYPAGHHPIRQKQTFFATHSPPSWCNITNKRRGFQT